MDTLKNDKFNLDKELDQRDNKRLRGQKIQQISNDLKNFEGDDKQKLLAYSQHLNWVLKTVERIYKIQSMAATAGVVDKSAYHHGMANGIITTMAVIMEEQGDPPYIKIPGKYRDSEQETVHVFIEKYVYELEELVSKVVLMDENGPKGYNDQEHPVLAWILDVLDLMKKSPIQSERIKSLRKDLSYEIRKRTTETK